MSGPKTIASLAARLRTLREKIPADQALFFIITEVNDRDKNGKTFTGNARFPTFGLSNGIDPMVSCKDWYACKNVNIERAKGRDMSKTKEKNADPSVSIAYSAKEDYLLATAEVSAETGISCGIADALAHPGHPEWLTKTIEHNAALLAGGNIADVSSANLDNYGKRCAKDYALAHNDTNDLAFIIAEIVRAYEYLCNTGDAIYKQPAADQPNGHPCNTPAFRSIATPAKPGAPIRNFTPNDFAVIKCGTEDGYTGKAENGKEGKNVVYDRTRISAFFKWAREPNDGVARVLEERADDPPLRRLTVFTEPVAGKFCYPADNNMTRHAKCAHVGNKRFDESTLRDFITNGSVIRGTITFDFSLTAYTSLKARFRDVSILRAPYKQREDLGGNSGFDDAPEEVTSMLTSGFAAITFSEGSTSKSDEAAEPELVETVEGA